MEQVLQFASDALHYVIPFLIVLSIVVFVHEFGHFWVARLCKVRVENFSIGFGPEIVGKNDRHGTRWKLAWFPLGGYVKMFGDADPASMEVDKKVADFTEEEKKVAFYAQSVPKRFAIVAAGPIFNYIFAIIVLAGMFMAYGQPFTPPVAESVQEDTAAFRDGIKAGDRILSIDGKTMESFESIKRAISLNIGSTVDIVVERDGKKLTLLVTPDVIRSKDRLGGEHVMGRLGVASNAQDYRELAPPQAIAQAVIEAWDLSASTLKGVGQMIMGVRGADELGGPLRIAEMSGKVAKEGFAAFIWFIAVISVNLGLINLFPIPLLDGGHLVFYVTEGSRGRPLSDHAQEIGAKIGLFFVASLMLFATWNDLVHLKVISFLRGLIS